MNAFPYVLCGVMVIERFFICGVMVIERFSICGVMVIERFSPTERDLHALHDPTV